MGMKPRQYIASDACIMLTEFRGRRQKCGEDIMSRSRRGLENQRPRDIDAFLNLLECVRNAQSALIGVQGVFVQGLATCSGDAAEVRLVRGWMCMKPTP